MKTKMQLKPELSVLMKKMINIDNTLESWMEHILPAHNFAKTLGRLDIMSKLWMDDNEIMNNGILKDTKRVMWDHRANDILSSFLRIKNVTEQE